MLPSLTNCWLQEYCQMGEERFCLLMVFRLILLWFRYNLVSLTKVNIILTNLDSYNSSAKQDALNLSVQPNEEDVNMTGFCKHQPCCFIGLYQYICVHTHTLTKKKNRFMKCPSALVAKQRPQFLTFLVTLREDWLLKLDCHGFWHKKSFLLRSTAFAVL